MPAIRRKRSKPARRRKATRPKANRRPRKPPSRKARRRMTPTHKWSSRVTKHSNALDLDEDIFKSKSPRRIAQSLKRSAVASRRRKGTPYQSAMSMLNFYINRAGRNLPAARRRVLESAKPELRKAFGRD